MRRVVLVQPGRVAIEEVQRPPTGPDDCVVAVSVAAVCSLDAHAFSGRATRLALGDPQVLGHEVFGQVLTPGASGLPIGTPVAVIGTSFCGACGACARGEVLACSAFSVAAGGYAEELVVPAAWCAWRLVPVDRASDPVAACYLDSIACAVRALNVGDLSPGDRLLVRGGGFMGCLVALIGKARGAEVTVVADSERSVRTLKRLDLNRTSNAGAARNRTSGHARVLVDVTGRRGLRQLVTEQLVPGGRLVLMTGGEGAELPASDLVYSRRLSIAHSFHSDLEDRREALGFLAPLREPLHLLSRGFPLADAGRALDLVARQAEMRCHLSLFPRLAPLSLHPA